MTAATEPRVPETRILDLLRDPNYLSLWFVGGFTGMIRWFQLLALGVYTFETTNSPLLVSLIPLLWMAPLALCGPAIGAVADRLNRKMLFIVGLVAVVAVTGVMTALAWFGQLQFLHIAVASFLSGIFWATDMPVRRRLIGDLSGGALSAAMSLDAATNNATRMLGPLLGGVILQYVGVLGVFLFSCIGYAICVTLVTIARVPDREANAGAFTLIGDLLAGARYVIGDANLRKILAITIVFNIWGFPFTSMIPVLGREQLGLSPFLVGVLSSQEGLGAFLGALLVAMVARPANYFRVYLGGTTTYLAMIFYLSILTYVAGGPHHSFYIVCVSLVVTGVAGACFGAMQSTLTFLSAAPEFRSRVLGVLTLCIGSGPIGFFNIGWMADLWGAPVAMFISSLEGLSALFLLWLYAPAEKADAAPN